MGREHDKLQVQKMTGDNNSHIMSFVTTSCWATSTGEKLQVAVETQSGKNTPCTGYSVRWVSISTGSTVTCTLCHKSRSNHHLTFIIESIYSVDACTLVVPSKKKEVLWILDLVRQQQADGFKRLLPTVHVVPEEEIVGLWRKTSVFKKPQKIVVLPVNVA